MSDNQAMDQMKGKPLWSAMAPATALGLLLALAWWAGNRSAANTDVEMRKRLLQNAIEMANAIPPELAKKLTFTKAGDVVLLWSLTGIVERQINHLFARMHGYSTEQITPSEKRGSYVEKNM